MAAETHAGGCHCGAVRFEAPVELSQVIQCNCSICTKRGVLWSFLPASQVKFIKGERAVMDYQFGSKKLHHLFCPNCGVGSFSRGQSPKGEEMVAINVRCLDDLDATKLKPIPFDGKSL